MGRGGRFVAVLPMLFAGARIFMACPANAQNAPAQIIYQSPVADTGTSTAFKNEPSPGSDAKGDLQTGAVVVTPAGFSEIAKAQPAISASPGQTTFAEECGGSSGLSQAEAKSLVESIAAARGDDVALDASVVRQESGFLHDQVSAKGAIGLMQLMPETAARLGVNPCKPEENIRGGLAYLAELRTQFGNPVYALAAYNAGPDRVVQYHGVPPFKETLDYVAAILTNYYGGAEFKTAQFGPFQRDRSVPLPLSRPAAPNIKMRHSADPEWRSGFVMNLD